MKMNLLVETKQTLFTTGLVKNKEGKVVYLHRAYEEDGKTLSPKSTLMSNCYVPGDETHESCWLHFALTLEKARILKEAGLDLGKKGNTPFKLRFIINTYERDGVERTMYTITNAAIRNDQKEWEWLIKPRISEDVKEDTVEIADDDLPF